MVTARDDLCSHARGKDHCYYGGKRRTTVPFWLGTASRDLAAVAVLSENLNWTRLNSIFLQQDFLLLSCIPKMHPAWISLFVPRSDEYGTIMQKVNQSLTS
jgi:hypothetical protein